MSRIEPQDRSQNQNPIVAFDFDGTLSHCDSVITFLQWFKGKAHFLRILAMHPWCWVGMLDPQQRGARKLALINAVLGEMTQDEFEALVMRFYHDHAHSMIRPDALRAWQAHQDKGHECVIVSGSMEILLRPFARQLKSERLIATEVEFDPEIKALKLISPNCIRSEKANRLKAIYGDNLVLEAAYGDTRGDKEMLSLANHPYYRVFKDRS